MRVFGFRKRLPITHPDAIVVTEQDRPVPTGHDLLVEVKAVSVNPVDTKIRAGKADDGTMLVSGWDAAGVVVAVGEDVTLFAPGDAVWYAGDVTRPGTHADYHLVDEYIVARKPESLSFTEAAAMPLVTLTAWESLHDRLRISENPEDNRGLRLLVVNGAGGVGSVALQLARRAGLHVTATASRPETRAWCLEHGADEVIGHADLAALPDDSFDLILCAHATDPYFDLLARLLKPFGGLCLLAGAKQTHNIQLLQQKSASIVWEYMFTHAKYRTPTRIRQHDILTEAAKLIDAGQLKGTLTETLPPLSVDSLRAAHERLEAGRVIGKLALPV